MADSHDSHGGHGESKPAGGGKGAKSLTNRGGSALFLVACVFAIMGGVTFIRPTTGVTHSLPYSPQLRLHSQCDGVTREITLGSQWITFNPQAFCTVNFSVKEGSIELSGPVGSVTLEPGEKRADLADFWFDSARAVSGSAVLSYQLVAPT